MNGVAVVICPGGHLLAWVIARDNETPTHAIQKPTDAKRKNCGPCHCLEPELPWMED